MIKINVRVSLVLCLIAMIIPVRVFAVMDGFTDPEDGMFDVSHWLAEKRGAFPIPIVITEPAIGYGAGAGLVFLHDPLAGRVPDGETFDPQSRDAEGKLIPPSISAVFGFYTENDTWMAGGVHFGVWKNDNIRYIGALATGSVNMRFYGLGVSGDKGIGFNIEPNVLYQGLKFRINKSRFFAGANYLLLDTDSQFDATQLFPGLVIRNGSRDAAVGFSVEYDDRDTIFTPGSGLSAVAEAILFREEVGSDSDFEKYKAKALFFTPLSESIVLGLRGVAEAVDGTAKDIPYYHYPFVNLRGIPVMRYQGETVAVGEAELRWNFTPRWSVLGFAGVGITTDTLLSDSSETVYSKGAGLRYFIARRFGAHVGFDIARGPEDTAFYLQFGHAWK